MKNTLAKNAVFNILYRVLNVLFPLITATYVSRVLEPAGIGKVAYAQNVVSYFVMFAVLGIPRYGTREIAKNREDPVAVNKLFSEILIINTLSTAICALGYYTAVFCGWMGSSVIYLVCGIELLFNFINIDWLYEGEEEYAYITIRSILIKIASIVALFSLVKGKQDYPVYALITCLGLGANNIFNILHARKRVKLTFCGLDIKRHIKPILLLALSVVASSLYNKVNVTMLGWLCDEESVGYYTNAHKVVNMVLTLVTAISGVFMPRLSYLYRYNNEKFKELITSGLQIVLFMAIPCCVGVALISDHAVCLLFGDAFLPAANAVKVLAILIIVIGAGDLICYQAIISSGNERLLIRSRIYAGVANVLLSILLIPKYQHVGAAVAAVISELIVNGMLLRDALQIVRPKITFRFIMKLISGTLLMAIPVIFIKQLSGSHFAVITVSVLSGVIVYLIIQIITKNEVFDSLRNLK